jgi:RNA polymerase sigma factor (sigma-70 family)
MPERLKYENGASESLYEQAMSEAKTALQKYRVEIGRIPELTWEEEKELGMIIATSENKADRENAIAALVESGLKLVVMFARRYLHRGLSLDDLIQEGNLGLMRAARKFDYTKNCRFSTYAGKWIEAFIMRGLADRGKTIRIPVHRDEQVKRFFRVVNFLYQKLERDATPEEISAEMEIPVEEVKDLQDLFELNVQSLDARIPGSDDNDFYAFEADENSPDPLDELEQKRIRELVRGGLKKVEPRNRFVLENTFGMNRGGEELNMAEIGRRIGCSREWIRQIQPKAIEELRRQVLLSLQEMKKDGNSAYEA